jgi:hypothetical protein
VDGGLVVLRDGVVSATARGRAALARR